MEYVVFIQSPVIDGFGHGLRLMVLPSFVVVLADLGNVLEEPGETELDGDSM
jgi:hypothetical protein